MKKGLVQVYTGDGKGKTTAAIGQAFRAAGRGLRVQIYQFLKSRSPVFGEFLCLEGAEIPIRWKRFDNQVPPAFQKGEPDEESFFLSLQEALEEVQESIAKGDKDLVILDEINVAMKQGWISIEDVLSILMQKPSGVEVILTGRGAPREILEKADLVTEMLEVKHPFMKGIKARKGIEY